MTFDNAGSQRFFYRDLSGGWEERDSEIPLKNILLYSARENVATEKTNSDSTTSWSKCFCHLHRAFENAQVKDGEVIFECGAAAKGVAVPFVAYTDYIARLHNKITIMENSIKKPAKHNWWWTKEKELLSIDEYQGYKKQVDAFDEMFLYPKDELPRDVFEIKFFENSDSNKFCLTITEIDRDEFYDKLPFSLNENFVKRTSFVFDINYFHQNLFLHNNIPLLWGKYKLPPSIHSFLIDRVTAGINKMAGKKLTYNTTLSGMELFNAATFFPYEPNVYLLLKYFFKFGDKRTALFKVLSPTDTDLVKTICNFYGAKPYRTL